MSAFDWKGKPRETKDDPNRDPNKRREKPQRNICFVRNGAQPVRIFREGAKGSHWYPSISSAARACGLAQGTVQDHVENGKPYNGLTFKRAEWDSNEHLGAGGKQ